MARPQEYSQRASYRPPAEWYRRLNWLGVALAAAGLAPRGVVALTVRGRRTGRLRRVPVVRVHHEGHDHLVALAGQSQWVRNVRAAEGEAIIRRGLSHRVHLHELPSGDRAPVIAAYLRAARDRGGDRSAERQAHSYFGLGPDPTLEEIETIVDYYPVFRITYLD